MWIVGPDSVKRNHWNLGSLLLRYKSFRCCLLALGRRNFDTALAAIRGVRLLNHWVVALKNLGHLLCSIKLLDIPFNFSTIFIYLGPFLLCTVIPRFIEQIFVLTTTLLLSFKQVDSRHWLAPKVPLKIRLKPYDFIYLLIILHYSCASVIQKVAYGSLWFLQKWHGIVFSG